MASASGALTMLLLALLATPAAALLRAPMVRVGSSRPLQMCLRQQGQGNSQSDAQVLHCTLQHEEERTSESKLPARRSILTAALLVAPLIQQANDAGSFGVDAAHAAATLDDYTTSRGLDQAPVVGKMEKLPSGVRFVDIKKGSGGVVQEGSRVSLQWVLRRSNGYFVDSSEANKFDPFIFVVGSGAAMRGLDEGIRGMAQGGVRRMTLPVSEGYTLPLDRSGGPVPSGFGPRRQIERELNKVDPYNYFFLEIEVTKVR